MDGTAARLPLARVIRAAALYFLQVFGAGFALALIRIPLLVPRLGVRNAELLEMPVMLAVIALASRAMARGRPAISRRARLLAGVLALVLLVAAELALAWALGPGGPREYIASRDPVSGTAYLVCLLVFALAPALQEPPGKR